MENNNGKIWGLDKNVYNQLASRHSKADIFFWLLGGLIYNYFNHNLVSISSALLILPGIFIASFAGIPAFWVNVKKLQIIPNTKNIFVLIGFSIWYLIDFVYPILLSIVFIKIVNFILSLI